jgi:hypothetical protein
MDKEIPLTQGKVAIIDKPCEFDRHPKPKLPEKIKEGPHFHVGVTRICGDWNRVSLNSEK